MMIVGVREWVDGVWSLAKVNPPHEQIIKQLKTCKLK